MSMIVKQVRHSGIVVTQMGAALEFYRDILGLTVYWDQIEKWEGLANAMGVNQVEVRTVKLSPDPLDSSLSGIELLQFISPRPSNSSQITLQSTGCTHLALQVTNLDSLHERMKNININFISEPQFSPDRKVRIAFCKAPENLFLELVELQS